MSPSLSDCSAVTLGKGETQYMSWTERLDAAAGRREDWWQCRSGVVRNAAQ